MREVTRVLTTSIGLGLALAGCTTTHTGADLRAAESREDARAQSEELRDEEIGEQGGENQEEHEEDAEWVERQSDL